jgi:hypothetical protein
MKVPLKVLLLSALFAGCSPNLVEITRITSNDQQVVVVVANRETSATVATPTELYLIGVGGKLEGEPFWRADNVEGLHVSWLSNQLIVVTAKRARIFRAERLTEVIKEKGSKPEKIEIQYRVDTMI